jgi:serine/threonine-protein kinase
MSEERNYPEAVTAWREVVRLTPDDKDAWKELGISLRFLGRFVESAEAHRNAARLSPGNPVAEFYLGVSLLRIGQDQEALATLRRAAERSKVLQGSSYYEEALKQAEHRVGLLPRLPAVIRGDDRPRDDRERLTLARMCEARQFHAAAARLFAEINETNARLAEDGTESYRYEAACAAAQAAAGQGKDEPPPDDVAKTKLRSQALLWLKAERDARARLLDSRPPQARASLVKSLALWKANPGLAPFRDPEAVAKLPETERKDWQALWAEVEALLKHVQ